MLCPLQYITTVLQSSVVDLRKLAICDLDTAGGNWDVYTVFLGPHPLRWERLTRSAPRSTNENNDATAPDDVSSSPSSNASTPRINCDISTSKSPSRKKFSYPSNNNGRHGGDDDDYDVGPGGDAKSYDRLVDDLRRARADADKMSQANSNLLHVLSNVVHSNLYNEDVINNRLQVGGDPSL